MDMTFLKLRFMRLITFFVADGLSEKSEEESEESKKRILLEALDILEEIDSQIEELSLEKIFGRN